MRKLKKSKPSHMGPYNKAIGKSNILNIVDDFYNNGEVDYPLGPDAQKGSPDTGPWDEDNYKKNKEKEKKKEQEGYGDEEY